MSRTRNSFPFLTVKYLGKFNPNFTFMCYTARNSPSYSSEPDAILEEIHENYGVPEGRRYCESIRC